MKSTIANPSPHPRGSAGPADYEHRSPRFALRAATAEAHARLDGMFSTFNLANKSDYVAFLRAQAPAFLAVEAALDAAAAERVIQGWESRRRSADLLSDLATLAAPAPSPCPLPIFSTDAAVLGAAYVLEGSRLGGAMLVRAVGPGFPTAFLTPGNPADWRAFISLLDERLSSEASLADAVSAALVVFAMFEQCARSQSGAAQP
ncbi:biliverdin-producing heme oxygenase [Brevundimonas sp.]|uniref:biliverdin-producing heme oxygenase n=1 Tax=Brevundimonas sp. TaxID=1871086 RepID=UPI003BABF254